MKKPEVGDTVVIHGTVTRVTDKCVFYDSKIGHHRLIENMEDLEDVIPKPWGPKVGDEVRFDHHAHEVYYNMNRISPSFHNLTLIHIHEDPKDCEIGYRRKWAVLAYKGDIPISVYFEDLREAQ